VRYPLGQMSARRIAHFALTLLFIVGLVQAQSSVTISAITPAQIAAGSGATDITITGTGFSAGSVVRVGGETVPVNFINATTLRVTVPPSHLTSPGSLAITVDSATASILVYSPNPPSITSLSSSYVAPGGTFTVTITGNNLIGAAVTINGSGITAAVSSGNTTLTLNVTVAVEVPVGQQTFTVFTPSGATGDCGISGPCLFNVVDGGKWVHTGPMTQDRDGHAAVLLLDGRVLVSGGNSSSGIVKTAEIYDPATNTWSPTGSMGVARMNHASVLLPDGRVLAAGGWNQGYITSAEIYDPAAGTWSPTGFMTQAFPNNTIRGIVTPDGKVLFPIQTYDPVARTFLASANPGYTGAVLPDDRVIVSGANQTFMYTPATNTASAITLLTRFIEDPFVQLLPDLRVFGRALLTGYKPIDYGRRGADAGLYDYVRDIRTQSAATSLIGSPVLLSDGRMLFAGSRTIGPSNLPMALPSSFIYDPLTDTVLPAADLNDARDLPVLTRLLDGRILATDGWDTAARSIGEVFTPPTSVNPAPAIASSTVTPGASDRDTTRVDFAGSNFLSTTTARLGDQRLVTIYLGSQRLTALVPPSLRSGLQTQSIVLTNPPPGGGSSSSAGVGAGPFLTGMNPKTGAAGTELDAVLSGSNLSGATSVSVSGSGIVASIVSAATSTSLTVHLAIAGSAAAGPRSVTVTTTDGSFTAQSLFTVSPSFDNPVTSMPLRITDVEEGAIRTGYVIVTPDAGMSAPTSAVMFGTVSSATVLSQGGILPTSLTTDAAASLDVLSLAKRDLGLAITNPGDSPITVNVTLRDQSGTTVASASLGLTDHSHIARFVTELFTTANLGSAFRGSLRIQSSSPFSILGLRFVGAQFAAVPVPGVTVITTVPQRSLASGTVGGANAVLFPQFALSGGWATQISLVNNNLTTVSGRVDVFDSAGSPMAVTLNGQSGSMFSYSLTPGASLVLAPRDTNGQTPF
jgi:hypothetical protein